MIFICYKKCSTCRGIQKILEEKRLHYSLREIDKEVPTAAELADWQQRSGLPLKRFFNTSGRIYRELHIKEKLPQMTEVEQLALLASDGMLIKRPILLAGREVYVGGDVKKYLENR